MTYYLLDFAPDGTHEVLRYTQADMEEIFTPKQRDDLERGKRIIHHWSKQARNHAICDMVITAKREWA